MIKQAIGRVKTATKVVTQSELDVLDLLRSDHVKVEVSLLQLRFVRNGEHRSRLLRQIRDDLDRHMRVEEDVVYPTCSRHDRLSPRVEHSFDEHKKIKQVLRDLSKMDPDSQRFAKLVTEAIRIIEDHVMEEEDDLFPSIRRELSELEFKRLNRDVLKAYSNKGRTARKAA